MLLAMQDRRRDDCEATCFSPVSSLLGHRLTDDAFCSAFDDLVYLTQKYVPFEEDGPEWQHIQEETTCPQGM